MIEYWRNLSIRIKTLIFAIIWIAALVFLAFIFPNRDNNGSFETGIDPVSGQQTSTGQQVPEKQEIPGAPVFLGMSVLLDRGMDFDTVREVREKLSQYYAENQLNGRDVTRFSFSQELTHRRLEDGATSIYTVKVALNVDVMRTLTVTVNGGNLQSITISEVDGGDETVIFE